MNGELINLFVGALIGILGSIVAYCVNHFLKLREQRLIREFEIREKGRDFYHQIYGIIAVLSGFVTSFLQEDSDEAMVLVEKGYVLQPKKDIIKRYKQAYEKYAKLWYESREKGLEVFVKKELADYLEKFWGYAGYFNEKDEWDEDKEIIKKFKGVSLRICDDMDKLLGLSEKKSRVPQWLKPKNWRTIIRGEKLD